MDCVGIDPEIQIKVGTLTWSCNKCKHMTAIMSQLAAMKSQMAALVTLPALVSQLKSELCELKSSKDSKQPMSYSSAVNPRAPPTKPMVNQIGPIQQSERRGRSNSAKRTRNEAFAQKPIVATGSALPDGNFKGVSKPPGRKHMKICRVTKENTVETLKDYCLKNGVTVSHVREISREDSTFKSFHCVFESCDSEKVDSPDFWPADVTFGRYYLNDEARLWLRKLNRPSNE